MKAEIITIGDELLIGQVIDTNSAWLAAQLNKIGIKVIQITSIPDARENIIKAFDDAAQHAELIIATGGLGPTSDDITKNTLAEYFNSKLIVVPEVLENIRALLRSRNVEFNARNIKQAELPDNCEWLHNSAGTAQGMWFKKNGKDYISLPGVPYEMIAIYEEEIEKRIKERFSFPPIRHITFLTCGIPESQMAGLIYEWEHALPRELRLAYLPSPAILRLRITGTSEDDADSLQKLMEEHSEKLKQILGTAHFGYNEDKLEVIIGKLLRDNNLSLSLAESCTGGEISSMITSVSGSSEYFKGGIVAYSNDIKTSELNVSPYTLIIHGAVSQAVVEQMSDGIRAKFKTDFSVAVSGIAGPTGGTEEKPIGTTWIAIASRKRIISRMYHFGEDRMRNIQKAAITALFMLREEIMNCL